MPDGAKPHAATPLITERDGAVLTLTLDAPQARNALSEAMLGALTAAIDGASGDRALHAIVLRANGPVFCAGHDIKEMSARRSDPDRGRAYFAEIMGRCAALMQTIVACPKPVIAAVEGTATAAGCQLVATCDLAVAGTSAKFCTPGVNIGLFCSTPMVALSRDIARKHAMEMLLLGEMMSAEDAARFGLVNRVVPDGTVRPAARAFADRIASKSPLTVSIGKAAYYRQIEQPLADAYTYAANVMVENMLARDAEEGIGAVIEKRTPTWQGR